jgi:UrcA family protein
MNASPNTIFQEHVMSHLITARRPSSRAKPALLVLGSLMGVLGLGAASAAPDSEPTAVVVKYGDLNLATDAGVNALYHRITYAARQACPDPSIDDLMFRQRVAECREQAVARAIRQVDNSRLAALYASHAKNG